MIYVVKQGDTLFSISQEFGVSVQQITADNQLYAQPGLAVGQSLWIPGGEAGGRFPFYATGYAYPFINREVLSQALPAMDSLAVFSYGFTTEGELVPPQTDDLPVIEQAWRSGTEPVLVLTPFGPDGQFNNYLVNQVSENRTVQDRLIENLLFTVEDRGYTGVDVDFEFILPEDRLLYAEFVGRLRERMNGQGHTVSVALAPKVSADQPGLLYEGIDYRLLGESADWVFLMTYEWGYTYGPPMAVAPMNKVRQVLNYAVSEIPVEKILLGIPNYGYDWPLPYTRGVTAARTIGNLDAIRLASEYGAEILFDETAESPYFRYTESGTVHEVWFEDVRSLERKLLLAKEYGLLGVGFWNLMRPFLAGWLLLKS